MSRRIEVLPHNPAWRHKYALEAALMRAIFGDTLLSIHHIGSTAIPGIKAKPVIDIIIVVKDLALVDALNPQMIAAGYDPMGERGIPQRRYFRKETDGIRSHHVHCYPQGHVNITNQINFRDYLRAHPAEGNAYGELKEKLAAQYRYDSISYNKNKTAFIERIFQLAADWRLTHPLQSDSD